MDKDWIESKAKENIGENFVRTILELSGYKVMKFGIENHNQEVIKEIKENYKPDTNRRLLSMPDLVVVDEETKESWLVEVKYRTFQDFRMNESDISFKYGKMKDYLDFWKEATLILVMNTSPYCLCIDLNKVNWNYHLKGKFKNSKGNFDEMWNFSGEYKIINDKFSKVTKENFNKALELFGLNKK